MLQCALKFAGRNYNNNNNLKKKSNLVSRLNLILVPSRIPSQSLPGIMAPWTHHLRLHEKLNISGVKKMNFVSTALAAFLLHLQLSFLSFILNRPKPLWRPRAFSACCPVHRTHTRAHARTRTDCPCHLHMSEEPLTFRATVQFSVTTSLLPGCSTILLTSSAGANVLEVVGGGWT